MKKKMLLVLSFIFIILFTSGCTVNYTLEYDNDTFTENLEVYGNTEDDAHPTYNDILENGLYADIKGIEKFTLEPESSRYDVTLTHTLEEVSLEELKAVSECFKLSTYKETDSSYYLALYGGFTCDFLNDSTFTLKTTAEVLTENSHEKKGNKYIWHLEEEKIGEEGIIFQVMKTTVSSSSIKTDTMLPLWFKILFVVIVAGIAISLIYLLKKASER